MYLIQSIQPTPETYFYFTSSAMGAETTATTVGTLVFTSSHSEEQGGTLNAIDGQTIGASSAIDASPEQTAHYNAGWTIDPSGQSSSARTQIVRRDGGGYVSGGDISVTPTPYPTAASYHDTTIGRVGVITRTGTAATTRSHWTTETLMVPTTVHGATQPRTVRRPLSASETATTVTTTVHTSTFSAPGGLTLVDTVASDQRSGMVPCVRTTSVGARAVVKDDHFAQDSMSDWVWRCVGEPPAGPQGPVLVSQVASEVEGGADVTIRSTSIAVVIWPVLDQGEATAEHFWNYAAGATSEYTLSSVTTRVDGTTTSVLGPANELGLPTSNTSYTTYRSTFVTTESWTLTTGTEARVQTVVGGASTTSVEVGTFVDTTTVPLPGFDPAGNITGTQVGTTTTGWRASYVQTVAADVLYSGNGESGGTVGTSASVAYGGGKTVGEARGIAGLGLDGGRGTGWWMEPAFESAARFGSEGKFSNIRSPGTQALPFPWISTPWEGVQMPMTFPEQRTTTGATIKPDGTPGNSSSLTYRWSQSGETHTLYATWASRVNFTGSIVSHSTAFELTATGDKPGFAFESTTFNGLGADTASDAGSLLLGGAQWSAARDVAVLGPGIWEVTAADRSGSMTTARSTLSAAAVVTTGSSIVRAMRAQFGGTRIQTPDGNAVLALGPAWDYDA